MTDFQFLSADGTTTNFTLRTDFIGATPSTENLTVCDIIVKADPSHYAALFQKIKYGVGDLRAFASTYGLQLISTQIAKPGIAAIYQALGAPQGFAGTVNSATQITLNWTKTPGATGYIVTRSTSSTFASGNTVFTLGDVATKVDTGLTTATHYYYRIQATLSGAVSSGYSYDDKTTS